MGLRGEAAIVGYVELPPERMNKAAPGARSRSSSGPSFGRRAGRRRAARRNRSTGSSPRTWGSRRSSCRRRWPNTWASTPISPNSSTSAARAPPGWCGAPPPPSSSGSAMSVLCALPARYITHDVGEEAQAVGRRGVLRLVEQPIRFSASRIRDPLRKPRPERTVRPGRPALCRGLRLRRARDGQDRGGSAVQRQPHRGRHLEGQAADGRGRARQPGDRRPAAHAGDRHAVRRWGGGRGGQRRRRQAVTQPAGVDQGIRRTRAVQDSDVRRRIFCRRRSPRPPTPRSA